MVNKIFIGGVHGVGKTYFCNQLSEEMNIPYFSASELISKNKKEVLSKNKKVSDISGNQNYLLEALKEIWAPFILLDGHFCLLNKGGEVEHIPVETFKSINPLGFLILVAEPNEIYFRLKKRDNIEHDIQTIIEFQEQEISYARKIADNLQIPFMVYKSDNNLERVICFINSINGGNSNE